MPASSTAEGTSSVDPDPMGAELNRDTGTVNKNGDHKHRNRNGSRKHKSMPPVEECRKMYRHEIKMLWSEVEEFRKSCKEQMERQRRLLEEQNRQYEITMQRNLTNGGGVTENPECHANELKKLEKNMNILERNQGLLDQEKVLIEKEELLAKRQEKLKDYEKEVEEAEAMLNKRQSLCDKRAKEVETLNEDLLVMRQDFISTVEALENKNCHSNDVDDDDDVDKGDNSDVVINSPEASAKARRHWTIARRHLIDKVSLLEATVQRYRTQLASASASVTAKDMMISRLNNQLTEMHSEAENKHVRIRQLESQLSVTTEEKLRSERNFDMLMEELQNIDIHSLQKVQRSPVHTPKHNGAPKHKHKLKKQTSSFSFFGSESSDKSLSPRNRSSSASSVKDHFKRKILNVNNHSVPSTNSLRVSSADNEKPGESKQRKGGNEGIESLGSGTGATATDKSALNEPDKHTTDAESKACTIQ